MKSVQRIDLSNDKCLPYWKEHLENGLSISEQILDEISPESGQFYTLLPKTHKESGIYRFETSILPSPGKDTSGRFDNAWKVETIDEEFSYFLHTMLVRHENNALFFEDALARPGDKRIERRKQYLILKDNEVFFRCDPSATADDLFGFVTSTKQVWHFLAVLTKGEVPSGPELTDAMIDAIMDNVSCIIIGAYDGEGYLFWEPDDQPSITKEAP